MPTPNDIIWMQKALLLAKKAAELNEVPVGAIVVREGEVLGEGWNQPISSCDPTGHAEICALRNAAQHDKNYRLPGTVLYVTIEPCTMCLGALIHARVTRVVFGAAEPKAGVLASNNCILHAGFYNHSIEWEGGVCEDECSSLMTEFFARRREGRKSLKANTKKRD
jgi:tRNA-adenosine deaminase (EC 3.5.4.-)